LENKESLFTGVTHRGALAGFLHIGTPGPALAAHHAGPVAGLAAVEVHPVPGWAGRCNIFKEGHVLLRSQHGLDFPQVVETALAAALSGHAVAAPGTAALLADGGNLLLLRVGKVEARKCGAVIGRGTAADTVVTAGGAGRQAALTGCVRLLGGSPGGEHRGQGHAEGKDVSFH